jgi:glycosyltransferase involved in cell wall biosynthesis
MEKIKIVHALAYYGNYIGGIQVSVEKLAKRQKEAGHQVKIITSDLYGKQKEIDGIDIIRVKALFSFFRVPFTPLLLYYLLKEDCDILHVHLPLPWLDICSTIKKMMHKNTKLIIHIRNYIPVKSRLSKLLAMIHDKFLITAAINKADYVITSTSEFAESLQYKIPKEKHIIVPNGVDIEMFYPSKAYKRNSVLFVGRIIPEKGLHVLMRALNLVKKQVSNVELNVIGAESYDYKQYESEIRALDNGFLTIRKNIPNNLMREFYADSACFVMPSLDIDSFGNVLIEAMACGCPVICSDLPGPSSIINKECGMIVPKGDVEKLSQAIIYMLENGEKMREKARKYIIDNYSWDTIYKQIEEIYKK